VCGDQGSVKLVARPRPRVPSRAGTGTKAADADQSAECVPLRECGAARRRGRWGRTGPRIAVPSSIETAARSFPSTSPIISGAGGRDALSSAARRQRAV
jgi:hypothetical protein